MTHRSLINLLRITSCISLVFTALLSNGQNGKILNQDHINYEDLSFYESLSYVTHENNIVLKKKYEYLDSLSFDSIRYISDSISVSGFMLQPQKKGAYPCIIFNRGGNRDFGELSEALMIFHLSYLAKQGYIIVATNYRGNRKSKGQDEFGGKDLNDVLNLITMLNYLPNADTSKIGLYGWSRGGIMTYQAMTCSNKIKTVVVGSSPSDLFALIEQRPEMETKVFSELIPNYETNKNEELHKRSVIKWVDKLPKNVPLLILHGGNDWRVPPMHATSLAQELSVNNINYRLIIFENGSHSLNEHYDEYRYIILNWFNNYLK